MDVPFYDLAWFTDSDATRLFSIRRAGENVSIWVHTPHLSSEIYKWPKQAMAESRVWNSTDQCWYLLTISGDGKGASWSDVVRLDTSAGTASEIGLKERLQIPEGYSTMTIFELLNVSGVPAIFVSFIGLFLAGGKGGVHAVATINSATGDIKVILTVAKYGNAALASS